MSWRPGLFSFPVGLLALSGALLSPAIAGEKLWLVGGGELPAASLARFCDWAGGSAARIEVITWATAHPAESFSDVAGKFASCHPARVDASPGPGMSAAEKAAFLKQLTGASAVFFTGGDQTRIMSVLADPELLQTMRALYRQGVPFGGTSAGTAIQSSIMFTGEGDWTVIDGGAVETAPALGLLEGVLLDTHFIRRRRENRLLSAVLKHPELLGVGIDEDTAMTVSDGRYAEVSGRGYLAHHAATSSARPVPQTSHAFETKSGKTVSTIAIRM